MREIGVITNEQQAKTFGDYLLTLSIRSKLEYQAQGWAVWVYEEEQIERSKQELARFLADPGAEEFSHVSAAAKAARKEAARKEAAYRKNVVEVRQMWQRPPASGAPLTLALVLASVLIAVLTNFGDKKPDVVDRLMIGRLLIEGEVTRPELTAIDRGQVWRLVTPILLHFSLTHLVFNVWNLLVIGGMIENRRGTLRFGALVLALAVSSNVGQYFATGPHFGGLSGVVYGLVGYAWMKARYAPQLGIYLTPNTVFFMVAWYFLCLTGSLGPIANTAHSVGFFAGIVIGIAPYWLKRSR